MSEQSPADRLAALGLTLPEVVPPLAAYVPATRTGNLVYTAGQLPVADGKVLATGKVGTEVSGFVASAPDFTGQPQLVNGASELMLEVFGDAGKHARSAVGVAVLPLDAPVEIELIVEVGD
jgi:enamine deaminase RidA (YjgF/YER057c/UK114 family)